MATFLVVGLVAALFAFAGTVWYLLEKATRNPTDPFESLTRPRQPGASAKSGSSRPAVPMGFGRTPMPPIFSRNIGRHTSLRN
jgi:hypothetical protein